MTVTHEVVWAFVILVYVGGWMGFEHQGILAWAYYLGKALGRIALNERRLAR